ncbi:MAG: transporter, partial [Gammaproteobacteria bacterium]
MKSRLATLSSATKHILLVISSSAYLLAAVAVADERQAQLGRPGMHAMMRPDRAPASVGFGDMYHMGRWMVPYRYMRMDMGGNRDGSDGIEAGAIASTILNRFSGRPMQPPTLRIVPLDMSTEMHMFGLMYMPGARTNWMLMLPYIEKEMDHVTFQGATADRRLGRFTTSSEGLGDVKAAALIRLFANDTHHIHVTGALSFPTGSITERATVLTPMNAMPKVRMPYPMQLGSGTYDLEPALTYAAHFERWSLGAQFKSTWRPDKNAEGYSLGDEHRVSFWGSYVWAPWLSTSIQLALSDKDKIEGIDASIVGPVQTADPNNSGGERIELGLGLNL